MRFKTFDYGVVSVALTRALSGPGASGSSTASRITNGRRSRRTPSGSPDSSSSGSAPPSSRPRGDFLAEDYLVFAVTGVTDAPDRRLDAGHPRRARSRNCSEASAALERRGTRRGSSTPHLLLRRRSGDPDVEQRVHPRHRDGGAGRPRDSRVCQLATAGVPVLRPAARRGARTDLPAAADETGWLYNWLARRYTRAARQVHSLFIDVNELTDKDRERAKDRGRRLRRAALRPRGRASRAHEWKGERQDKLKTLDDIYRFTVEQTAMARGEFLELTSCSLSCWSWCCCCGRASP